MAVCFKENQRFLSNFLRMWWKYERASFSAVGAYTFRADCISGFDETKAGSGKVTDLVGVKK